MKTGLFFCSLPLPAVIFTSSDLYLQWSLPAVIFTCSDLYLQWSLPAVIFTCSDLYLQWCLSALIFTCSDVEGKTCQRVIFPISENHPALSRLKCGKKNVLFGFLKLFLVTDSECWVKNFDSQNEFIFEYIKYVCLYSIWIYDDYQIIPGERSLWLCWLCFPSYQFLKFSRFSFLFLSSWTPFLNWLNHSLCH